MEIEIVETADAVAQRAAEIIAADASAVASAAS